MGEPSSEKGVEVKRLLIRQKIEQFLGLKDGAPFINWGYGNGDEAGRRVGELMRLMVELPEDERDLFAAELKEGLQETDEKYHRKLGVSKEDESIKSAWGRNASDRLSVLRSAVEGLMEKR